MEGGIDEKTSNPATSFKAPLPNPADPISHPQPTDPQMMAIMAAQEQIKRQLYGGGIRWPQPQQQTPNSGAKPQSLNLPDPSSSAMMQQQMRIPQHHHQQGNLPLLQMQQQQILFGRLGESLRRVPTPETCDETAFFHSLAAFLGCLGLPLRKVPSILGRPVSIMRLYQIVTGMGGFQRVSESQRWMAVAVNLGYPPSSLELLASIHSLYYTLLYAYEQYMFGKVPPEKIECKMMIIGRIDLN